MIFMKIPAIQTFISILRSFLNTLILFSFSVTFYCKNMQKKKTCKYLYTKSDEKKSVFLELK